MQNPETYAVSVFNFILHHHSTENEAPAEMIAEQI
jgi:hypothetical protein